MRNLRTIKQRFMSSVCHIDDDFTQEERAIFANEGTALEEAPAAPVADPDPTPAADPAAVAPVAPAPAADPAAAPVAAIDPAAAPSVVTDPAAPATPSAAADPAAPPTMVPHAALHAERVRNAELARQNAALTARMAALTLANTPANAPAALDISAAPDKATDPVGYLNWLEKAVVSLSQARVADSSAQSEAQRTTQIDQQMDMDEKGFIHIQPDYPQAAEHYIQSRSRELLAFTPRDQVEQIMRNEIRQVAQMAWQRGMPAAQAIYSLAQARGYVTGQRSVFAPPASPSPVAPAQVAAPVGVTPAAQLAAVRQAQAVGKSLSGAGGAPAAPPDAAALLAMNDDDFMAHMGMGKLKESEVNRRFAEVGGA